MTPGQKELVLDVLDNEFKTVQQKLSRTNIKLEDLQEQQEDAFKTQEYYIEKLKALHLQIEELSD